MIKGFLMLIALIGAMLIGEAVAPVAPKWDEPVPVESVEVKPELPLPVLVEEPEPVKEIRYILTEAERNEIEQVVMAEAGGECWEGQVAVAQCILNAADKDGIRPDEVLIKYQYTSARKEPSEGVQKAVSEVFDDGLEYVGRDVLYFYAPARVVSNWHESQQFAIEIGGHRFFRERG